MTLGQSIRHLRTIHLTITQQQFAYLIGISQSYMSQIESDKKIPTIETLQVIAGEIGVEVSEIFIELEK